MEDVSDQLGRARRIEHHACLLAEIVDLREDTVEMDRRGRFRLDKKMIGTGLSEGREIALRRDDHQVYIKWLLRAASYRLDDHWADRDIRHEAAVHDVDMDPVGSRRIDGANLLGKTPEIRRQDRRCDDNGRLRQNVGHGCPGAQRTPAAEAGGEAYMSITAPSIRSASSFGRWNELRPMIEPNPPPAWIARISSRSLSSSKMAAPPEKMTTRRPAKAQSTT